MTNNFSSSTSTKPLMEQLDLDSFLNSISDSDTDNSDGTSPPIPHRTVDDILNDSDSSSSASPPHTPYFHDKSEAVDGNDHEDTVTVRSLYTIRPSPTISRADYRTLNSHDKVSEPNKSVLSKYNLIQRFKSDDFSAFTSRRPPSSSSSLFGGGVRVNAKPGAALAAAVAASRSIPSPHAAALKSRRASSVSLDHKVSDTDDLFGVGGLHGVGDSSSQVDFRSVDGDDHMGEFQSAFDGVKLSSGVVDAVSLDVDAVEKSEIAGALVESSLKDELQIDETHISASNLEIVEDVLETAGSHGREHDLDKKSTVSSTEVQNEQRVDSHYAEWDIVEPVDFNISTAEHSAEMFLPENDDRKEQDSRTTTSVAPDSEKVGSESENKEVVPDSSIIDEVAKLVEDRLAQLESERASKMTEQNSLPHKKPLEVAEELEKKHASTGLHWAEGAVAQPMRLEGVRRGSTVLGYFDIDAENTVTRTISTQAFRRDHGSAQVVAVHQNCIAIGMSRGVVLVVPSKYSVYHPDNLDAKMSMLGLLEEKSSVTSLCFNQQGDLLLAGYGDGHVTLWDVARATPVKVITGEHSTSVVHALFLGQQFRAVTGDCKGLVLLHTFSVGLLGRYTVETQCLLDGQKTGKVLCASPLLPDGSGSTSLATSQSNPGVSTSGIGGKMGGVVGGYSGWKLFSEGSSLPEEGVVIFVTYQTALVVRLTPSLEIYAQLSRPDGVREGSMPYTAWKCTSQSCSSSTENMHAESSDKISLLAIAWDRKVQVAKLVKSDLKVCGKWTLDSAAIGLTWLDDQMLVILTLTGQLCLFARDGTLIHQTSYAVDGSRGDDLIAYHTHFTNIFGNPEKAYHNCVAVRGASVYILGPTHLVVSRLLPWKERIQVLRKAGDWMGSLNMAMTLYDGHAHGVIDLPRSINAVQEAIMPYLVELLLSYVDEVFSYISVACFNQIEKIEQLDGSNSANSSLYSDIKEQFTRVGGVAVEFCVHIKRTDILFDEIFSKFVASQHRDTFLELLEPYILKDMLGSLPPEIMQALVEHYNSKGWLQRVEQCVLHMDISSLDFNQVVRLCQEHGLYGALIYLFNKGLDDFRSPLEELLAVLRNNERDSVTSLGYRLLVYLKHCFLGLAFPPGHGTLPSERLPSLRTELLQFLLQDSGAPKSRAVSSLTLSGAYLNLYFLLELDTEATLDVLRFAFEEHQICKSENMEVANGTTDENMSHIESQNSLLQKTVDALVLILDVDISQTVRSSGNDESESHSWPSKNDIGYLIEFIASYVADERAMVSKSVLSQLLEYLTSENNLLPDDTEHKNGSMRKREKQVLALLNVVPETEWNASYVLHLCENAKFYQVCGLIHSVRRQSVAALDSYMKDVDEPVQAFSFIEYTLSLLSEAESASFLSAVRTRIPELAILSRECTFVLVIDHFNKESGHILSELQSHPKSLFLYLKTVIEVHLSGTLNFSCLRTYGTVDDLAKRRVDDQRTGLQAFLDRCSDFPKYMRQNPVEVTDGMVELYLELLCKFEPDSVLKFLETFESYRVEHCLRLCQEYGIIDGAAFLLERVGDVGNALALTLTGIDDKFVMLEAAVDNIVLDGAVNIHTSVYFDAALESKEVELVRKILHACVGLCQRNTPRLDPEESESLWFLLLDSFCKPLMISKRNCEAVIDDEKTGTAWRIRETQKGAPILKRLFAQFIKEIVEGMIGYVRLPSIMSKLLADNGCQEFGDFKLTILGMLGTYGFERRILETAKSLIEDDTFYTMSMLKKGASHGYGPRSLRCGLCNCPFNKASSSSGIRVYSCGHATHLQCEQENDASSRTIPAWCPICVSTKKVQSAKIKTVEQSLVCRYPSRLRRTLGASVQNLHENDAFDNSRGLHQISRFEILTNLQMDQRSIQIESIPQLRLAPPAVYHEKVNKGTYLSVGESRGSDLLDTEKPNKSRQASNIKVKESSSSLRFPLKSKIFGKDKIRIR